MAACFPATVIRSCLRRLWGLVWTLWPERWGGALAHPTLGPQESLGKPPPYLDTLRAGRRGAALGGPKPPQLPWNRLMQLSIAQGGRGGGRRGRLPQRPAESHLTPMPPPTKLPSPGQQMWVILLATGDLWTPGRQIDCTTTLPSSLSWTSPKAGLPVVRTRPSGAPPSSTLSFKCLGPRPDPSWAGRALLSVLQELAVAHLWEVTWQTVWLSACSIPVGRDNLCLSLLLPPWY